MRIPRPVLLAGAVLFAIVTGGLFVRGVTAHILAPTHIADLTVSQRFQSPKILDNGTDATVSSNLTVGAAFTTFTNKVSSLAASELQLTAQLAPIRMRTNTTIGIPGSELRDLEVSQDAIVDGKVALTSTGPTITKRASDPNTVQTEARGSLLMRTDVRGLYQNTDGATDWLMISGPESISISQTANANTNFSTLGTFDWLYVGGGATANPNQAALNTIHNKTGGGMLYESWSWQSAGATAFTATIADTYSSAGSDDQLGTGAALSTTQVAGYFTGSSSLTGFGARVLVPAATTTQVLRIYVYHFSDTVQIDVRCRNSLAGATSATHDAAAGVGGNTVFVITYRCSQATTLNAVVFVSVNHGSSPNILFAGASLGAS